jgi:hypothetical protein
LQDDQARGAGAISTEDCILQRALCSRKQPVQQVLHITARGTGANNIHTFLSTHHDQANKIKSTIIYY